MTLKFPTRRPKSWRLSPRQPDCQAPRSLVFSPLAWLKLQFLCHAGPTEVGGFGLAHPDNLLRIEDVLVVKQRCSLASVAFDDTAVADLCDDMADAGVPARQFFRLWIHTHPGASVEPSGVDESTFAGVFGDCDWAVMAILGRTGRMSARLQFNVGPRGATELRTRVDWSSWPADATQTSLAERLAAWQEEYASKVEVLPLDEPALLHLGSQMPSALPDINLLAPYFPEDLSCP